MMLPKTTAGCCGSKTLSTTLARMLHAWWRGSLTALRMIPITSNLGRRARNRISSVSATLGRGPSMEQTRFSPLPKTHAVSVAVGQRELALYRHWLLMRRWLINHKRRLACLSYVSCRPHQPLPPHSVSVLTLLNSTRRAIVSLRTKRGISSPSRLSKRGNEKDIRGPGSNGTVNRLKLMFPGSGLDLQVRHVFR
jgi:hypothetical protein